ncbi:MAG: metallo-mystery pair system four-Cys motif protein [Sideroxydans sp.]|nr:metallo-mystery pair system four-Cys motif protein [Sideroxydans sp.]
MKKLFLLALFMPFAMAHAAAQKVELRFAVKVGDAPFACGRSYEGIGTTKSRITPSDLRFYVSEVALIDARGNAVPLQLEQDGVWQYRNLALLDFEDGTGPCRNGNSGLHTSVVGSLPKGDYRGLRFTLGVPFDLNHGDPTIAYSPLNLSAMFWVWQSGYRFVKIDMASSGQPQAADMPGEGSMKDKVATMEKVAAMRKSGVKSPKQPARAAGFSVHLGSTACTSSSLTLPPSECLHPNRVNIVFDKFDVNKDEVVADLAALLQEVNVDVNAPDTAPGCMSAENDADCPGIFAAFGLPFGEQPAVQQRFFTVR